MMNKKHILGILAVISMISTVLISLWATHRPSVIAEIYKVDLSDSIQKLSPVIQTAHKVKLSSADYQCLLKNVYYEAGVENRVGKIAVAQVTLNRLDTGKWGTTVCQVVHSRKQFSWTLDRSKINSKPSGILWEQTISAVDEFLSGTRITTINNSTHYHAVYIATPAWGHKKTHIDTIGQHIFYASK
jgi:spore germination cell wall hydrolase CwlJ-like protein